MRIPSTGLELPLPMAFSRRIWEHACTYIFADAPCMSTQSLYAITFVSCAARCTALGHPPILVTRRSLHSRVTRRVLYVILNYTTRWLIQSVRLAWHMYYIRRGLYSCVNGPFILVALTTRQVHQSRFILISRKSDIAFPQWPPDFTREIWRDWRMNTVFADLTGRGYIRKMTRSIFDANF